MLTRPMRLLVFFDLPTTSDAARRRYTKFRKFLLRDGYHMLQYSVYARFCNGLDAVEKHEKRLQERAPGEGSIRLMVVTDKQYGEMDIIVGDPTPEEQLVGPQQLTIF